MSNKFVGQITNGLPGASGVNLSVVGLEEEKVIIAPTLTFNYEKDGDKKALAFTMTPSSGDTEPPKTVTVETKNCSEKVTAQPTKWEVEITASSASKPAEFSILFFEKFEE